MAGYAGFAAYPFFEASPFIVINRGLGLSVRDPVSIEDEVA